MTEVRGLGRIPPQRGQGLAISAIMPFACGRADWPPHAVAIGVLDTDGREVHSEIKGRE